MTVPIGELIDLDTYPLDRSKSAGYDTLVTSCRQSIRDAGLFSLPGFMHEAAVRRAVVELAPAMRDASFTHAREHNIYFSDNMPGIDNDHPALATCRTTNHTLCDDQLIDNPLHLVYEYQPLRSFLSDVMDMPSLYLMKDHMARMNVMAYRHGEALNWHFDRSHFTTTLLLQNADSGGEFQYRRDLRSAEDPNYDGVAKLMRDEDPEVHTLPLQPGTLNVFLGVNTAHRTTEVRGERERLIAVFSYYDRPDVEFSTQERVGFYGRAA